MTKKVLIVDDSATARALFAACMFGNENYETIQASNWQDGLAKAKEYTPFLAVLDYNMPEKTGAELAQLMQQQGINCHYVLLSANTQPAVVDEVMALGFAEVIEKPVSAESVTRLLEQLE